MVFFNYATMQMAAKIVYYGPGLCGKTTNLHHIYGKTSPQSRGEMVSLETETDRTLFFDLLPIDVGVIGGFKTRLQLYTVPGQVFYNTTRKLVLKGADGIVFVADSQRPMVEANAESFRNLRQNLAEIDLDLDEIPLVVQLNKRDLPNVAEVDTILNALDPTRRREHVEASAFTGVGVFETLKTISKLTLRTLRKRMMGDESSRTPPPMRKPIFLVNSEVPAPRPIAVPPEMQELAPGIEEVSESFERENAEVLRQAEAAREAKEAEPVDDQASALPDPETIDTATKVEPATDDSADEIKDSPEVAADEAPSEEIEELVTEDLERSEEPSSLEGPASTEELAESADTEPQEDLPLEVIDETATAQVEEEAIPATVPIEADADTNAAQAPPLEAPTQTVPAAQVKRVKVHSSVDVMAELENLRKRATQTPPKGRRSSQAALDALESFRPRREQTRSVVATAGTAVVASARTLRLTAVFESETGEVVEQQELRVELEKLADVQALLVNLKFDLTSREK